MKAFASYRDVSTFKGHEGKLSSEMNDLETDHLNNRNISLFESGAL